MFDQNLKHKINEFENFLCDAIAYNEHSFKRSLEKSFVQYWTHTVLHVLKQVQEDYLTLFSNDFSEQDKKELVPAFKEYLSKSIDIHENSEDRQEIRYIAAAKTFRYVLTRFVTIFEEDSL